MKKRGVSPVIATVLLIGIVVVIGLIVFMWLRGIQEEAITKFDGTNVKIVCEDVSFDASYSNGFIYLLNDGNVPIYKIKAKITGAGTQDTVYVDDPSIAGSENDWNKEGLLQGDRYSGSFGVSGSTALLVPVLIGSTADGNKAYTCDDRFGKEITIA